MSSREEFEAWFESNKHFVLGTRKISKGDCFFVWQASRAALVIELPPKPLVPEEPEETIDDSHMDAYHSAVGMRHACLKFIEAAGVKVKS